MIHSHLEIADHANVAAVLNGKRSELPAEIDRRFPLNRANGIPRDTVLSALRYPVWHGMWRDSGHGPRFRLSRAAKMSRFGTTLLRL